MNGTAVAVSRAMNANPVDTLSALDWSSLALAALMIGAAKTSIGGLATLSVAVFATILPAKESTGALLPLLLVGDVVAVASYRRHADWAVLLRLLPTVAAGVGVGAVFLSLVDDATLRRTIGAVLLAFTAAHLWQRRSSRQRPASTPQPSWLWTRVPTFGVIAGFTTMVANAGGPVMTLYLLSAGFGMLSFLGTGACFFFAVNVLKVPFSAGLGLITPESLTLNVILVPAVLAGAVLGRTLIRRLDEVHFARLVLLFGAAASLNLVVQ